ncbi:hypothetical protein [Tenacibaculum sp. nBUS_03]|uniref:hypothetical protein n=1 Tax=Tenacibaculum sp. nBUS_03 TaxID=3395320 RepID=UPI003EBCF487
MKSLELNQMEGLQGGDWGDWVNGACSAVLLANIISKGAINLHPAGLIASSVCAGWGIANGLFG